MERKYTIFYTILIILALVLVILPKDNKNLNFREGLNSTTDKSRYLSVDQVTHRIIENDPTLMLIDLRPADQFKKFSLPGSINMHPHSLLSKSSRELLSQQGKDKILLSGSEQISENAWERCVQTKVGRIYIMKGGMEEWSNTIMKEQPVSATASTADLDLVNFRNAAHQYFTGESTTPVARTPVQTTEKVTVTRKAPAASSGGGC